MESLDLDDLHMSGARAVFSGPSIDEDDIADALAEQGLELASYKRIRRPRAAAVYHIDSGVT